MNEILKIIQERQSARVPFDPNHPISKEDLKQILEAGKWAPTAHNMQNFDALIIDDKEVLEKIGKKKMAEVAQKTEPMPLTQSMRGRPTLVIIMYDSRKRAPASRGDILGFMSLGCVMENMWLMAQSLGIGLQILSSFSAPPIETRIKKLLNVPEYMKIAYSCRLGYPTGASKYLRVRRDIEDFTHHNRFGNKGI
jgi:nitroreductase